MRERTYKELRYLYFVADIIGKRYRMLPADVVRKIKKQYFDGSTKGYTTIEWEEIMSKIRSDFSKKGIFIQKPNEEELYP